MNEVPRTVLYDYWRSSASYRVRIALNLKGLDYEQRSVALAEGAQRADDFLDINPQGLVPALVRDGRALTQSLAICEYLDETFPDQPLLPGDAALRAEVRSMALVIAADVHPLNNLRVQNYLKGELGATTGQAREWMHRWMNLGFAALEARLAASGAGNFCVGDQPTLADLCLVAQAYNADRFECSFKPYPILQRVIAHCRGLEAFDAARPERQPDAPAG